LDTTLQTAKEKPEAKMLHEHVSIQDIDEAALELSGVAHHTPLVYNELLSEQYDAHIWLKREDLQVVRSYKIRGAYNMIQSLPESDTVNGVVCASAGNHAQGVAFACRKKKIKGTIFMPVTTPEQKVHQVKLFGREYVEVVLDGDTFDDAFARAKQFCEDTQAAFIPPFDHPKIIAGQGTVGKEIWEDADFDIDYIIAPVGGGGLSAGIGTYIKHYSPKTHIIGIEPEGAPAMLRSIEAGHVVVLEEIDKFVDGAAVKKVGKYTYDICSRVLDQVLTVPEGKVCGTILELYNDQAIVVEPAGALSIAALDNCREDIKGKNVICVLSGSNNDIMRTAEIKERSLMYEGLKHYFIVDFPQRAGALKEFLAEVLGPNDDITYFEYSKKTNRDLGPALIGLELKFKEDIGPLIERMKEKQLSFEYVNEHPQLFRFMAS
jgi:threonine dehydratase